MSDNHERDRESISSLESIDSSNPNEEPQVLRGRYSKSPTQQNREENTFKEDDRKSGNEGEHEEDDEDDDNDDNDDNRVTSLADMDHQKTNGSGKSGRVSIRERRGLLPQLALLPEYHDARDCPAKMKHIIVFIVAFAAICGPMGTSIMLPAIDDVVDELNTQVSVVNISVGIYLLSLGIFPLWWSSFSETHGRRSVYIVSFIMFLGFSVGCALSPNITALIIFRVLCGGCSASVQAVGAGTIGDLYAENERGAAMGWYYLGPLMGPFLAPILGGAVAQAWGWRATQWVLVIASGIAVVLIIVALPETLRKQDNMAEIRKLLAQRMEEERLLDENDEKEGNNKISRQPSLALVQSVVSNVSRRSHSISAPENSRGSSDEVGSNNGPADYVIGDNTHGAGDPIMPSLSRLTTAQSDYSRRITRETLQQELTKSLSQTTRENMTRSQRTKHELYEHIIRPMHAVVLLAYPPVLLVVLYSAASFALIYFFNMTITYEYSRPPYSFSVIIVGLCYIPNSVTYVIASIIGGRWNDLLLRKYAKTHNGDLRPESRISWNIVTAILLFPPACLIFGWSLDKGVHWVVPLVGTAIFGFASMLVIGATVTYLVDTLPGKGATGVAINNLIRQVLAAVGTFVVEPLLRALGPGVLFSILMGILTVSSVLLLYLKLKGDSLRAKYDIRKYYDKL